MNFTCAALIEVQRINTKKKQVIFQILFNFFFNFVLSIQVTHVRTYTQLNFLILFYFWSAIYLRKYSISRILFNMNLLCNTYSYTYTSHTVQYMPCRIDETLSSMGNWIALNFLSIICDVWHCASTTTFIYIFWV